jgi:membrane protease YdiL (CAAX protease family)
MDQSTVGYKRLEGFTKRTPLPILIGAMLIPFVVTFVYFVLLRGFPSSVQQTSYLIGKGLQFTFPAVWCLLVLREPRRLPLRSWAGAAAGFGFGLMVATVMWFMFSLVLQPQGFFESATTAVQGKMLAWRITNTPSYALLTIFYVLIHSALEEYYWRWFVYRHLSYQVPETTANLLSSLGFMAHHVLLLGVYFGWASPFTYLFSLAVAIGGSFWAWLYQRTGSLLGPWISHMLVDAAIFVVGYTLVCETFK